MRHNENVKRRILKAMASIILSLSLVVGSAHAPGIAYAATSGTGVIKCAQNDWVAARSGPGTNYDKTGKYTGIGVFTIVAESEGEGATKWGKLKSNAGWISLDYAKRI